MQNSKYPTIYERIDHIKGEIRLLKIQPSTDHEAPICCELFRQNLDSGTDYTALSYCWGPLDPAQIIALQGQDYPVTPNLHAAMKQLRSTDTAKIMWIDALCIDQSNNFEKGHQVGQMGNIYENAALTVMWLGQETENCGLAKEWTDFVVDSLGTFLSENVSSTKTAELADRVNLYLTTPKPVLGNLNVNYWTRAWIVQEVVLSRNLVVVCGSIEISWNSLQIVSDVLDLASNLGAIVEHYQRHAWHCKDKMRIAKELESMRKLKKHKQAPNLLQGLFTSRLRCATDHRDYTYSSLGFIKDSYGIVPNYELCAECVYIDTIERIITQDKSLDVLSLCKGFHETWRAGVQKGQKMYRDYIDWLKNGELDSNQLLTSWHIATEKEEDNENNEYLYSGCTCSVQTGEMWERFTTDFTNVHPGLYLGVKSWVPNWPYRANAAGTITQDIEYKLLYQAEQCHFRASGTSEASFQFSTTKKYLTVSGFLFDRITYITSIKGPGDPYNRCLNNFETELVFPDMWMEIERRGTGPSFYGDGVTSQEHALARSLASGRGVDGGKLTDMDIQQILRVADRILERIRSEGSFDQSQSNLEQLLMRNCFNDMVMTSKGAIGAAEMEVQKGDLVCILFGARIPFILRPNKDKYFLIGEAYIDGIMEGELMKEFEEGKYEKMDFCLL